jgi:hypothetical protein
LATVVASVVLFLVLPQEIKREEGRRKREEVRRKREEFATAIKRAMVVFLS